LRLETASAGGGQGQNQVDMPDHVLPNALQVPAIKKLSGKRIVLASNSPRRKEIFSNILVSPGTSRLSAVTDTLATRKGLKPDIVPSTFAEDLPVSSFEDVHEYAVSTATHKAVEVYERLVVCPSNCLNSPASSHFRSSVKM
jgi:septum formation protein